MICACCNGGDRPSAATIIDNLSARCRLQCRRFVRAFGVEADLIMCAENRWPNLSLEMQLPMRDLSYPPWSVKVGTRGQYGVGVNRQWRPPQPDKPDWLKALRQSPEDDAQK